MDGQREPHFFGSLFLQCHLLQLFPPVIATFRAPLAHGLATVLDGSNIGADLLLRVNPCPSRCHPFSQLVLFLVGKIVRNVQKPGKHAGIHPLPVNRHAEMLGHESLNRLECLAVLQHPLPGC